MKSNKSTRGFIINSLVLSILLVFSNTYAQESQLQDEYYGDQAKEIIPEAKFIQEGNDTEYPSALKFDEGKEIQYTQFESWMKSTFDAPDDIKFNLKKTESDDLGFVHYKYSQSYKGIPIDRAEYIVQTIDGKITSIRGDAYTIDPSLNTVPTISEENALEKALLYFDDDQYRWNIAFWEKEIKERTNDPNASYFPTGELIITKFGTSSDEEQNIFRLAYAFDVYGLNKEQRIIVDAKNGKVLYTLDLASHCTSASVNSIFNGSRTVYTEKYTSDDFRLRDDCQGAKLWIRDWNSATTTSNPLEIENTTNTWTTTDERFGATVLWETKESYDYFNDVHGRNSYDNSGGNVTGYINAVFDFGGGPNTDNASMSFSGGVMKVGLGSSGTLANSWSSLDIIAHEYTHAVTGSSSSLVYQGESGALNESFSDIFGDMVENYSVGPNDWLMGDDRTDGAIRSMSDPNDESDPDTYLGSFWKNTCNGCSDAGGVHSNSGVQNYWFFLISMGGSGTNDNGDDYDVSPIGKTKASAIAFRNQTVKLTSGSNYAAARTGAIEAAEDLYGACSDEVKQVTNAWYAVGVGDPYVDVEIASYADVSCAGAADGSITVAGVGEGLLSYSWNDGPVTQNRSGLSGGNYTVTLTDATGCPVSASQYIDEPLALSAIATATSDYNGFNISCKGLSDGVAEVAVSGGTMPYGYLWDTNAGSQTTAIATNLAAGTYGVTVTDANGCVTSADVTLDEPPILSADITNQSDYNGYNISCNGGSDGWATVAGDGGVKPYSYLWSDGQLSATATDLSAGYYSVTITDANGCEESTSITLTEPTPLTIEAGENQTVYYGYPPAECATIEWSGAGGGVPPYIISWDDGGLESHEVCPGEFTTEYTVTITDANGCEESDVVIICVIDVRCGKKLNKVELCHVPEEDPSNTQSICVSINSVESHLAHGDMLANCDADHACPPDKAFTTSHSISEIENELGVYPNPFTYSTTLTFLSKIDGNVSISLYDVTGRELLNVFNGKVKAEAKNQLILDASMMNPGINYCIVNYADGSQKTQKIIFTK